MSSFGRISRSLPHDTQLFLGCTDSFTAKHISDRTGEVTVGVASKTKNLNTWRVSDYTPEYREARSLGKRKLLTPDEVLRLPVQEALVIMRGQKVLKIQKFDYTKHPHSKLIIRKKASTHIPEWRKEESIVKPTEKSKKKLEIIPETIEARYEIPKRITLNKPSSATAPNIETKPKAERSEDGTVKQRFGKVDRDSINK